MTSPAPEPGERLQKLLARAGLGSRRVCDEIVGAGRVTVDGRLAKLGDRARPDQRIEVDGVPVGSRPDLVYRLLNKPAGVVTTASDPQSRPTVVELVPDEPRVFPVGRLDADSEGLLLLTNDGELAQLLTHPRHGVEKVYVVEVDGVPDRSALARLRTGVLLDDGPTAPARARVLSRVDDAAVVEVAIHEGRKRQVRRMAAAVGHPVVRLVRTRIGPVADARLAPGRWRDLTPAEVRALYRAAAPSSPASAPGAAEAHG